MSEYKNDGWPESFDPLPHPLRRVGSALAWFFSLHQSSPVSDHFNHPLDVDLQPVVDWPVSAPNQMVSADDFGFDDMGTYLER